MDFSPCFTPSHGRIEYLLKKRLGKRYNKDRHRLRENTEVVQGTEQKAPPPKREIDGWSPWTIQFPWDEFFPFESKLLNKR